VTTFYDRFASSYDWVTRWISRYQSPQIVAERLCPLANESSRVLDVGIGTGASIRELVRRRKFGRIVGVDKSKRMLARCRENFPKVELIEGEISDLGPEFDQQFDLVVSCGAVEHIRDLSGFLRHCHRLLRGAGHLLFTYEAIVKGSLFQRRASPHLGSFGAAAVFRHEAEEMEGQLQKHGFIILEQLAFRAYFWLRHRMVVAQKT
jgi:ubiquinone/menaquinone biosynthesis C-methylase UbiE